jgi:hypothetical protein|mmetsp:Transcript_79952/g.126123  ORF Transcript_79952/g.126123 Transcript_79952/m.126123 type:complete len:246 (+) Transcript_79952:61-798(+)
MAVVPESSEEERLFESHLPKGKRCDSFDDAASDCSTTSGSFDNFSDQGEEGDVVTLTFFDWDDTLFPTTWLQQQGLLREDATLRQDQMNVLGQLASSVEKTLRLALQFGRVVIVTNAQQGWVQMSCAKMMPSLRAILDEVDIVSARSTYEDLSHSPSEWKRLAFQHELRDCLRVGQYNLISVGDSLHEQRAVMSLCDNMHNCFSKSMKFLEVPAVEQLIEEHEFVVSCFLDVAEHNGNLDVEVAL